MAKTIEVDISKLKEGSCKILDTDKGKLAVCKEKGKIKVYAIETIEE